MAERTDSSSQGSTEASNFATAEEGGKGLLPTLVGFGPVFFGVGFMAPLIAQSLDALGLEAPVAPSNVVFGLVVGTIAGVVAWRRGSWL